MTSLVSLLDLINALNAGNAVHTSTEVGMSDEYGDPLTEGWMKQTVTLTGKDGKEYTLVRTTAWCIGEDGTIDRFLTEDCDGWRIKDAGGYMSSMVSQGGLPQNLNDLIVEGLLDLDKLLEDGLDIKTM